MARVEINKDNNEARLMVDMRFYDYDAVLRTAHAFTESCWVYLDGDAADKLLVCLKPKSSDIKLDRVGYEFYNYAIGLMKNAAS